MGIELYKNGLQKNVTGFLASSKTWEVGTRYRKQINLGDSAVTRYGNLVIVDMSGWTNKPAAADWTNYVRVYECLDATEAQTEINSQTIDQSWAGGNHDAVCFLQTQTDTKSTFIIYYGDIDLGAPGYTSDLTVTADTPAAGDYQIIQADYYQVELDYSAGGIIYSIKTRVSGAPVEMGNGSSQIGTIDINKAGTSYSVRNENAPTITEVEGTTGASAGAVLVAFKVTGVSDDTVGAGGAHLQDNSAVDIPYEIIYVFCNCQLFMVKQSTTLANNCDNIRTVMTMGFTILNTYFSHQSYKYGATHAVEVLQTRTTSANYDTRKYNCYFDITSNDGVVVHFDTATIQNYETVVWLMEDAGGYDQVCSFYPDNSGSNTTYVAGTETETIWIQVDDFTEADGVNDDDGDQPAHRKNTELLTALTQTETEDVMF